MGRVRRQRAVLRRAGGLFALTFACVGAPASASFAVPPNGPGQYAPRDECSARPGGAAFLASLRDAVTRRDARAFAALSSPDIVLDFGGGGGREAVIEQLGQGSRLWRELDALLALGCAWDEDNAALVLPWIFHQDLGDVDPYAAHLALGAAIPLRERPRAGAKVRLVLNWQLIHVYEVEASDPGFETVALIGSDFEGYVRTKSLRSLLDYRLRAERVGDAWQITSFVAGE